MSKFWILNGIKLVVGVIFLQTLFFKFSAAEESVFIFSKLGVEPWGRIGSGLIEFFIIVLFFNPRFVWIGALVGIGAMFIALASHVFIIGIEVAKDHGLLFILALINFIGCCILLYADKESFLLNLKKVLNRL